MERQKRIDEYDVDHDMDRRDERKVSHLLPARHTKDTTAAEPSSVWHGKKEENLKNSLRQCTI